MADTNAQIDMLDPRFRADPYPTYARLRREAPVCKIKVPGFGREAWIVSRYDEVVAALKDSAPVERHDAAEVGRAAALVSALVPYPRRIQW